MDDNSQEESVEHNDRMNEYRNHIVLAEQKSIESYDKGLLSLSGGTLGWRNPRRGRRGSDN